ncbi:V-type proton ATPase subunit H-like [Mya arenaria]|uniref:V-type proton ATPase subunit H-like n=1 Tax=Mya arenaria TaxID=6604 RepID=UPI0022DEDB04|nr:V-type proton ATPase subunit H-like [Mya arenaria]XP_052765323.1 V-type proton ATPase subunit H-like [Mya arenaria]
MAAQGNIDVKFNIDDIEKGAQVATSLLQQRANDVRNNRVNWQSYLQGQMISNEDFGFISKFDNANTEQRHQMLQEMPGKMQFAKTFFNLMSHIAKDQTLQYILTMLDDVLQEDKSRVEILKQFSRKNKESVWTPFLHLLDRNDRFIVNQTSRIVAKIACWGKEWMESNDLKFYLNWLKDQLILPGNEYLQTAARCLQMMLRVDQYRFMFVQVEGVATIVSVLDSSKMGFQIQYQLIFCLWCLTFNPVLLERMNKQHSIIPILADILSDTVKEKVSRIILATFRNLTEKPEEREIIQENALSMVQCKVLKQLELLDSRKYDDPDIVEDLAFLQEKLQESVQDLSSFDEYVTEIKSGRLEWSPVHKSDRFWRENAIRLNEKNYELLKILVRLLEGSRDPLILSVAAHDIGEYVRYYPRGKNVIEQLGAKHLVMQYLTHEDPNVRYEALIAVQKLMVHNWEYLGKQISQASQDDTPGAIAAKS